MSTANHMGIAASTFESAYRFFHFASVGELKEFVGGKLENAPKDWTYSLGNSINVDQNGDQPKGSDSERLGAIGQLKRVPPIVIVKRKNGDFALVDGSHRLSYATDFEKNVAAVFFDEQ